MVCAESCWNCWGGQERRFCGQAPKSETPVHLLAPRRDKRFGPECDISEPLSLRMGERRIRSEDRARAKQQAGAERALRTRVWKQ